MVSSLMPTFGNASNSGMKRGVVVIKKIQSTLDLKLKTVAETTGAVCKLNNRTETPLNIFTQMPIVDDNAFLSYSRKENKELQTCIISRKSYLWVISKAIYIWQVLIKVKPITIQSGS